MNIHLTGAPTLDGNGVDGSGSGQLDTFLQAMSRLKGALNYFERHNPQSIELENVRKQYEVGSLTLPDAYLNTDKIFVFAILYLYPSLPTAVHYIL